MSGEKCQFQEQIIRHGEDIAELRSAVVDIREDLKKTEEVMDKFNQVLPKLDALLTKHEKRAEIWIAVGLIVVTQTVSVIVSLLKLGG